MSDLNNSILTVVLSLFGVLGGIIAWGVADWFRTNKNTLKEIVTTLGDIKTILSNHGIHIDNIIDDAKDLNSRLDRIEQRRRT